MDRRQFLKNAVIWAGSVGGGIAGLNYLQDPDGFADKVYDFLKTEGKIRKIVNKAELQNLVTAERLEIPENTTDIDKHLEKLAMGGELSTDTALYVISPKESFIFGLTYMEDVAGNSSECREKFTQQIELLKKVQSEDPQSSAIQVYKRMGRIRGKRYYNLEKVVGEYSSMIDQCDNF